MSQYCKWDDLQEKMLKAREEVHFHENRLEEVREEVHLHENRLEEIKAQFTAKLMNRESLLAYWTEQLAIATAEFKQQDSVVQWHHKMLGL